MIEHSCERLHLGVTAVMDGKEVPLPPCEAIVVLNIACWGAGVRPWGLGVGGREAAKQDFGDGKFFVYLFFIYIFFYLA